MHGEMNKNDCFNNLIQIIVKICEIAQFTRATPGKFSSFIIKDEIKSRLFNLICQDFRECGMHFEVPSVDANKYRYKVPKERSQNMH